MRPSLLGSLAVAMAFATCSLAIADDYAQHAARLAQSQFERDSTGAGHTQRRSYCLVTLPGAASYGTYVDFREIRYIPQDASGSADRLNGITANYLVGVESRFQREVPDRSAPYDWQSSTLPIVVYSVVLRRGKWQTEESINDDHYCFFPQRKED